MPLCSDPIEAIVEAAGGYCNLELDLADGTSEDTIKAMCEKLLANTVIESYRIEVL